MKGKKGTIDSPMTGAPAVKGIASAPGTYSDNPALGPAGESGGFPLKFMDTAIAPPKVQPTDNSGMVATPTKKSGQ